MSGFSDGSLPVAGEEQSRVVPTFSKPGPAMTGQQMQSLAKDFAAKLQMIKQDIELRKWAVDQAISFTGAKVEAEADPMVHPVSLAREIHAFLVEGAAEKAE
jgi:hypothetical protein